MLWQTMAVLWNHDIQGDTVRLVCDSASSDLRWTVGGRVVTEAAGSRLLELAASRRLQGAAVTCAATTEAGTSTATLQLDIKCELTNSTNLMLTSPAGQTARCSCLEAAT